jgi:prolyl-tRNA synthetase
MFAKWIESYRDLPLLINQWCNIVRWEMRTRLFLRTAEFLWQEGHTAHATKDEALEETLRMLDVYADFVENWLAVPVIKGEKTAGERFPGAVSTYCIEAMMQDRKALQAGTSHFLGQNFSKAADIKFLSAAGAQEHAWTTSWGMTTRLIGAMVMVHSDDDGLILPPRIAPVHVVIIPITMKAEDVGGPQAVLNYCQKLADDLRVIPYHGRRIEVEIDHRDMRGGDKVWGWIKKGVPLRIEIGPRDMAADSVFVGRRDKPAKEKQAIPRAKFVAEVSGMLDEIQDGLLERAKSFRAANTKDIDSKDEFYRFFTPKNLEQPEIHGGFAMAHFCGDPAVEAQIRDDLGVTVRCIPLAGVKGGHSAGGGKCVITGKPSAQRVVWAKAY